MEKTIVRDVSLGLLVGLLKFESSLKLFYESLEVHTFETGDASYGTFSVSKEVKVQLEQAFDSLNEAWVNTDYGRCIGFDQQISEKVNEAYRIAIRVGVW